MKKTSRRYEQIACLLGANLFTAPVPDPAYVLVPAPANALVVTPALAPSLDVAPAPAPSLAVAPAPAPAPEPEGNRAEGA